MTEDPEVPALTEEGAEALGRVLYPAAKEAVGMTFKDRRGTTYRIGPNGNHIRVSTQPPKEEPT